MYACMNGCMYFYIYIYIYIYITYRKTGLIQFVWKNVVSVFVSFLAFIYIY